LGRRIRQLVDGLDWLVDRDGTPEPPPVMAGWSIRVLPLGVTLGR
jgi:hypothetical protein